MNIYYMLKQNKGYKQIAKTEQKFARIINSFVVLFISWFWHIVNIHYDPPVLSFAISEKIMCNK